MDLDIRDGKRVGILNCWTSHEIDVRRRDRGSLGCEEGKIAYLL